MALSKRELFLKRRLRVRNKLRKSNAGKVRLSVHRSSKNISAQLIDDVAGKTLASASSPEKDVKGSTDGMNKTDIAKKVGSLLGERAKKAGVSKVAFDRGSYKYHGRIKALADGAREAGLEF